MDASRARREGRTCKRSAQGPHGIRTPYAQARPGEGCCSPDDRHGHGSTWPRPALPTRHELRAARHVRKLCAGGIVEPESERVCPGWAQEKAAESHAARPPADRQHRIDHCHHFRFRFRFRFRLVDIDIDIVRVSLGSFDKRQLCALVRPRLGLHSDDGVHGLGLCVVIHAVAGRLCPHVRARRGCAALRAPCRHCRRATLVLGVDHRCLRHAVAHERVHDAL